MSMLHMMKLGLRFPLFRKLNSIIIFFDIFIKFNFYLLWNIIADFSVTLIIIIANIIITSIMKIFVDWKFRSLLLNLINRMFIVLIILRKATSAHVFDSLPCLWTIS